jgi:hypothetical protein
MISFKAASLHCSSGANGVMQFKGRCNAEGLGISNVELDIQRLTHCYGWSQKVGNVTNTQEP